MWELRSCWPAAVRQACFCILIPILQLSTQQTGVPGAASHVRVNSPFPFMLPSFYSSFFYGFDGIK